MNTITHALLPAIAAGIINRSYRAKENRRNFFTGKQILLIGVFGAAPDLINPHLTLAARYTSWSHSLIFFIPLILILTTLAFTKFKNNKLLIATLVSAYLLHLICDTISGGIAWLYPLKTDIIGSYIIPATTWIPLDVISILTAYFIFRVFPMRNSLRIKSS